MVCKGQAKNLILIQRQILPVLLLLVACVAETVNGNSSIPNLPEQIRKVAAQGVVNNRTVLQPVEPLAPSYIDDSDTFVRDSSGLHDRFSWQLLKTVLQDAPAHNNVIISPFSIKLVLAMLSEAAGMNTKTLKELIATQTDVSSENNVREFYRKTLNSFNKDNELYNTLNVRTKLYTDKFIEIQLKFAGTISTFYNSEMESLDFSNPQESADAINSWASNVTQGRLQDLVTGKNIQNSVILLTNLIYFTGMWRHEFKSIHQGAFMRSAGNSSNVEFMEHTDHFYYHKSDKLKAKILRLPYKGKNSMFVLLPEAVDGIFELQKNLDNLDLLKSAQGAMAERKVKVTFPKFHFDYAHSFQDTLKQLGVQEIFEDTASLPGLARGADVAGKLKVSSIIQKAGIDVNEKGTEAFAATVVEIENKFGGVTEVHEFRADHPFIFYIEDSSTGSILFAGKVHDPQ